MPIVPPDPASALDKSEPRPGGEAGGLTLRGGRGGGDQDLVEVIGDLEDHVGVLDGGPGVPI